MNNGQMEVIELPDTQFYLEVENKELGTAEKETGKLFSIFNFEKCYLKIYL